jgi:hypothetical protein
MSSKQDPAHIPLVHTERVLTDFEQAQPGQWYWLTVNEGDEPLFVCLMKKGTNFVELHEPHGGGHSYYRTHRDRFSDELELANNPLAHIRQQSAHYQSLLQETMEQIGLLAQNLGLQPRIGSQNSDVTGTGLALLSESPDVKEVERSLVEAKNVTLPELFNRSKELSKELGRWLSAESMPLLAQSEALKESTSKIDDRIFNIQLYSGLVEEVTCIAEGDPAAIDEKLRVMQRRLYIDEECLLAYETGGITIEEIEEFDAWISKTANRERILPFPRCMVSMQVRRKEKDRPVFSMGDAFVNVRLAQADKTTYLLIRNGEQLFRLECQMDFGELMFPDKAVYDPSEPVMVRMFAGRPKEFIARREFEALVAEEQERKQQYEQWFIDNPQGERSDFSWRHENPIPSFSSFNQREWNLLDDDFLYFDECMKVYQDEIKEYNRLALLIQGLYDRSAALVPHHPVQLWKSDSFSQNIEFVYDSSMALLWGDEPDIEAYRESCNALTTADSVMWGQQDYWLEAERDKEYRRIENDWRIRDKKYPAYFRPLGNDGPGRLAKMALFKPKSRKATFTWEREKLRSQYYEMVSAKITVPLQKLFNVSAYKPGDFRQFFRDPRTRAKYLEWAPMLLTAEEYHAGNLQPNEPLQDGK